MSTVPCPRCHQATSPGDRFCHSCGLELTARASHLPDATTPNEPPSTRGPGAIIEGIQRFFVSLALLFGAAFGLFLLFGPDSVRAPIEAEIPRLELVAAAMTVLCATFLVALLSETFAPASAVTFRFRALRWVGLALVVGAGAGAVLRSGVGEAWQLWRQGRPALATVERVTLRRTAPLRGSRISVASRSFYQHDLAFDGRRATLNRDERLEPGATVEIVYHPERPQLLLPAEAGSSFFALLRRGLGLVSSVVLSLILALCLVTIPIQLWSALVGPRAPAR